MALFTLMSAVIGGAAGAFFGNGFEAFLVTLSAVIVLFLIADRLGARGWVRQVAGWRLLVGSTLSFVFVNLYMLRQPGQEKAWAVPFYEVGIALSLGALPLFFAVCLVRTVTQKPLCGYLEQPLD